MSSFSDKDRKDRKDRTDIADALNEVWAYLRTVAPSQSGLDGWHIDALLYAAQIVRPKDA